MLAPSEQIINLKFQLFDLYIIIKDMAGYNFGGSGGENNLHWNDDGFFKRKVLGYGFVRGNKNKFLRVEIIF